MLKEHTSEEVGTLLARKTASELEQEKKDREDKLAELAADCETLIASPAFGRWFERVIFSFGGVEPLEVMSAERQGQFQMLRFLKDTLLPAKSAPEFLASITRKYYEKKQGGKA